MKSYEEMYDSLLTHAQSLVIALATSNVVGLGISVYEFRLEKLAATEVMVAIL